MAVYDRFGRLLLGSPTLEKTVLEFVVFERHLTNPYGSWRLHDKIVPEWAPPPEPIVRSYAMPKLYEVNEEAMKKLKPQFKKDDSHLPKDKENEPKNMPEGHLLK